MPVPVPATVPVPVPVSRDMCTWRRRVASRAARGAVSAALVPWARAQPGMTIRVEHAPPRRRERRAVLPSGGAASARAARRRGAGRPGGCCAVRSCTSVAEHSPRSVTWAGRVSCASTWRRACACACPFCYVSGGPDGGGVPDVALPRRSAEKCVWARGRSDGQQPSHVRLRSVSCKRGQQGAEA